MMKRYTNQLYLQMVRTVPCFAAMLKCRVLKSPNVDIPMCNFMPEQPLERCWSLHVCILKVYGHKVLCLKMICLKD